MFSILFKGYESKMSVTFILFVGCSLATSATRTQQTWVNDNPKLEIIINKGVDEAKNLYSVYCKDKIILPGFQHRANHTYGFIKRFEVYKGELRSMESIARVAGTNVTWVDENKRILSFYVRLMTMEITYDFFNQTHYHGIYDEGSMLTRPENNLLQVNCSVERGVERVEAMVEAVKLVKFDSVLTRVKNEKEKFKYIWVPERILSELEALFRLSVAAKLEYEVLVGVDEGLKAVNFTQFCRDYFWENDTDVPPRI